MSGLSDELDPGSKFVLEHWTEVQQLQNAVSRLDEWVTEICIDAYERVRKQLSGRSWVVRNQTGYFMATTSNLITEEKRDISRSAAAWLTWSSYEARCFVNVEADCSTSDSRSLVFASDLKIRKALRDIVRRELAGSFRFDETEFKENGFVCLDAEPRLAAGVLRDKVGAANAISERFLRTALKLEPILKRFKSK